MDATNVGRHLKLMKHGALLMLAITSAFVLNRSANGFFSQFLNNSLLVGAFSIVAVYVVILSTDLGLGKFLPWASRELLKSGFKDGDKRRKIFTYALLCVCVLQLSTSIFLTWNSTGQITEFAAGEKPTDEQLQSAIESRKDVFQAGANSFDAQIAEAKETASQRLSAAKRKGADLVKAAEMSKGQEMYRLYKSGKNGWAEKQLAPAIEKAKADSASIVAEAMALVATLQKQKSDFITSQSENDLAVLSPIKAITEMEVNSYVERSGIINSVLRGLCIIWAVLFVGATWLLSLFETSVKPDEELHDKGKGLWQILGDATGKFKRGILDRMDNSFTTKFAVAGVPAVATKSAVSQWTHKKIGSGGSVATPGSVASVAGGSVAIKAGATAVDVAINGINGKIMWQGDLVVFCHTRQDGNTKNLLKEKVSQKMRDYKRRVKETTAKIEQTGTTPAKQTTLKNRLENYEAWKAIYEAMMKFEAAA